MIDRKSARLIPSVEVLSQGHGGGSSRRKRRILLILLALLPLGGVAGCPIVLLNCCQNVPTSGDISGTGSGFIFVWLAAVKDTYYMPLLTDPPTPAGADHGCDIDLRVGYQLVGPNDEALRTYVDFLFPEFPPGSEVREAYLNLYHPSNMGDGTPDNNMCIPGTNATDHWDPCVDTEPPFTNGHALAIRLRSQAWSGSADIYDKVQDILDGTTSFDGWVLYWNESYRNKDFWSNNHPSRTRNSLGFAPRLLLRVELPPGATAADIVFPPLPSDNDLGDVSRRPLLPAATGSVLMMLVEDAADRLSPWPTSWDVHLGSCP
ncbi:MAG: hypothetical protein PVI86_15920 [Phycisphaerae bacterium]|jgi:hypothetical protein